MSYFLGQGKDISIKILNTFLFIKLLYFRVKVIGLINKDKLLFRKVVLFVFLQAQEKYFLVLLDAFFPSPPLWRKTGVRTQTAQIYFTLVERIPFHLKHQGTHFPSGE